MYAVIQSGGKQYRVTPGDLIQVESLAGEAGDSVHFDVLFVGKDNNGHSGDAVGKAVVTGTIVEHAKGDKVIVFKFKRRKMYRRKAGHRQLYTGVKIEDISLDGKPAKKPAAKKAAAKPAEVKAAPAAEKKSKEEAPAKKTTARAKPAAKTAPAKETKPAADTKPAKKAAPSKKTPGADEPAAKPAKKAAAKKTAKPAAEKSEAKVDSAEEKAPAAKKKPAAKPKQDSEGKEE